MGAREATRMKRTITAAASIVALAAVLAACGSTSNPTPPTLVGQPPAATSPSPPAGPPTTPSPVAAVPTPSPTRRPTPRPTAKPKPTPIAWTDDETALLGNVRQDAAVDCRPRRSNLPERSIAGIECGAENRTVDRVGVYLFRNSDDMGATYLDRLAEYGIGPN